MNTTKILGESVDIQSQGIVDRTETQTKVGLTSAIIIGQFKRGRVDRPMVIHNGNIRGQLSYEPNNPYYMAVQDCLDTGVPSVEVLRVGSYGSGGPSQEISINATYDSSYQTMTVTGAAGLFVETKDSNGNVIGSGVIGSEGTVTYTLNTAGQVNNAPIYTKSALSNTVSHSLVVVPSNEIPSNEMHFTTLAGSADYVGTQGDQILLSDGSIVDITITDNTVTFNVPSGKHTVKLVELGDRSNYVSVGGGALVELHNFPTLSTVTKFNFSTYEYNPLPNLTKVPDFIPSNITNLLAMFYNASAFNQDLNNWNVSNVTSMNRMFYNASAFNQDLNNWNVSNVTSMNRMFANATSFNQPLNNWNVSNVTNMVAMFRGASAFNQPLNNWNVSNVTNMDNMFSDATSFNQDLNNWNVSNVTSMYFMFHNATSFNQPLNNWNVSNVTNMYLMFAKATSFNQPLNNWNVSNVTNMVVMFSDATSFNQPLNNWNVSNVTNMGGMFRGATSFNQPLNNWNVSNVTNMVVMFRGATSFNQPLNNWNVSNVTNMDSMFSDASAFNQDLSMWCVSNFPTMPTEFNNGAPFLVGANLPVWGTCPAP